MNIYIYEIKKIKRYKKNKLKIKKKSYFKIEDLLNIF